MRHILVVGPSVPKNLPDSVVISHHPLITLKPFPITKPAFNCLKTSLECSAIIITSKHAIQFFSDALLQTHLSLPNLPFFCIGTASAQKTSQLFPNAPIITAAVSTQEGLITTICTHRPESVFWPHSSKARTALTSALPQKGITVIDLPLYEPIPISAAPSLEGIDEILFTCPSSVDAFFSVVPKEKLTSITLTAIGPITEKRVQKVLELSNP